MVPACFLHWSVHSCAHTNVSSCLFTLTETKSRWLSSFLMICLVPVWSTALISSWSHRTIFVCSGTMFFVAASSVGGSLEFHYWKYVKQMSRCTVCWLSCGSCVSPIHFWECHAVRIYAAFQNKDTGTDFAYLNGTNWWALYERIGYLVLCPYGCSGDVEIILAP